MLDSAMNARHSDLDQSYLWVIRSIIIRSAVGFMESDHSFLTEG